MMPPHCKFCRKNHRKNPEEDFKLIRFPLTPEEKQQKAAEDLARSQGRYKMGHPIGAHWFCQDHGRQITAYKHMTWPEARAAMKKDASRHRSYRFTHALCREPARSVVDGLRLENMGNPDYELMCRQHEIYIQALIEAGVTVNILPARDEFPDSVFVEDAALVLDGAAILMQPGAVSRAGEPIELLEDGRSFFKDIIQQDLGGPIDGGDILCFDDVVLVGMSARTSEQGADSLARIVADFGYELRKARTPETILHFKSHCSLLDERTAIATSELARSGCFDGFDVVIVPEDEPQGSNVIRVNDKIILSAEAPKTVAMLRAQGFDVLPVPTTEVAKIDGAVSCCSLRYSL